MRTVAILLGLFLLAGCAVVPAAPYDAYSPYYGTTYYSAPSTGYYYYGYYGPSYYAPRHHGYYGYGHYRGRGYGHGGRRGHR